MRTTTATRVSGARTRWTPLAGRVLADGDTKPGAHVSPHVSLVLSEATWHAARAESARRRRSAADAPSADEPARYEPARYEPASLEDGTPVPPSELAIALCDCDVTRIVVDADGAPLDLGRTQRLFTGPQRRAVIARDRECAWPTCHAHARWCDIHHLDWWGRDGGATAVDRGVLLCVFHHHETHRLDLSISRHPVDDRAGPGAGATAPLSRFRYEFTDPAGRRVGETSPPVPRLAPTPPPTPTSVPARPRVPSPRVGAGREPPDPPPPLEWGVDPVTGERVLAWFLDP